MINIFKFEEDKGKIDLLDKLYNSPASGTLKAEYLKFEPEVKHISGKIFIETSISAKIRDASNDKKIP